MTSPLLFIAHGSSRTEANQFMIELVAGLFPKNQVSVAFLESASPSIPEALSKLAESGTKEVRIIPLFLVPGNHTTKDIPKIIGEMEQKYPRTRFILEKFIGDRPEFAECLRKMVQTHSHQTSQTAIDNPIPS